MARARRIPGLLGYASGEVTEEMRDRALQKTLEIVSKLDAIRKRLELPADQLELVSDTYGFVLMTLVDEAGRREHQADLGSIAGIPGGIDGEQLGSMLSNAYPYQTYPIGGSHGWAVGTPSDGPNMAKRTPMPIRSLDRMGKPCKIKSEPFEVVVRPQGCAYRIEGLEIEGDAARWIVDDIKVGNRSQFVRPGSVPGRHFVKGGMLADLRLETLQTAMDFAMIVRYVGPEKDGEEFSATAVGSEA